MIHQFPLWIQPGVQTLSRWKRKADARFGVFSRLAQFCMVGASGMVVDLSLYAVFQRFYEATWLGEVSSPFFRRVPLAITAASISSIFLALVWNFLINRKLTFNDAKRTGIVRQFAAYGLGNALAIGISFGTRVGLPNYVDFFRNHYHSAAVIGIIAATGVSFSMSRWLVFRTPRVEPNLEIEVDIDNDAPSPQMA